MTIIDKAFFFLLILQFVSLSILYSLCNFYPNLFTCDWYSSARIFLVVLSVPIVLVDIVLIYCLFSKVKEYYVNKHNSNQ